MLTNKYSKIYFDITNNAKHRITEGYTELHHIIPQSMGCSNDKENLVKAISSEKFKSDIIASTKWSTFRTDYRMFRYFKKDFYLDFL